MSDFDLSSFVPDNVSDAYLDERALGVSDTDSPDRQRWAYSRLMERSFGIEDYDGRQINNMKPVEDPWQALSRVKEAIAKSSFEPLVDDDYKALQAAETFEDKLKLAQSRTDWWKRSAVPTMKDMLKDARGLSLSAEDLSLLEEGDIDPLDRKKLQNYNENVLPRLRTLHDREMLMDETSGYVYSDLTGEEGELLDNLRQYAKEMAEISERYRPLVRDKALVRDFERKVREQNAWMTVSAVKQLGEDLRPIISEAGRTVLEYAETHEGDLGEYDELFLGLDPDERSMLSPIIHMLKPNRDDTWLAGDAARAFWDQAVGIPVNTFRAVEGAVVRSLVDGEAYQAMREAEADLMMANQDKMREWGFWGSAVVGAIGTLPYMGYASIPYAGVAAIAADASQRFEDQVVEQGGDVAGMDFFLAKYAIGASYAAIEKLQTKLLTRKLAPGAARQAHLDMFHSIHAALKTGRIAAGNFAYETWEEGLQEGLEKGFVAWGLDEDVVSEAVVGIVDGMKESAGTMALLSAGGVAGNRMRYRRGAFDNADDALASLSRLKDLQVKIAGNPAGREMKDFSAEYGYFAREWLNKGRKGLLDMGLAPMFADNMAHRFHDIWNSVKGDESARRGFADGGRVLTMAEYAQKAMPWLEVTTNADGTLHFSSREGAPDGSPDVDLDLEVLPGEIKLNFKNKNVVAAVVDLYNRGRSEEEQMTVEAFNDLGLEDKEAIADALKARAEGYYTATARTGAKVDSEQLESMEPPGNAWDSEVRQNADGSQSVILTPVDPVPLKGEIVDETGAIYKEIKAKKGKRSGIVKVWKQTEGGARAGSLYDSQSGDKVVAREDDRGDTAPRGDGTDVEYVKAVVGRNDVFVGVRRATDEELARQRESAAPLQEPAAPAEPAQEAEERPPVADEMPGRMSGRIRLAQSAVPSAQFHEMAHAVARFLVDSGQLSQQDIDGMRALFGEPRNDKEEWNEEPFAEAYRGFLQGRVNLVEDGMLRKFADGVRNALKVMRLVHDKRREDMAEWEQIFSDVQAGNFSGIPMAANSAAKKLAQARAADEAREKARRESEAKHKRADEVRGAEAANQDGGAGRQDGARDTPAAPPVASGDDAGTVDADEARKAAAARFGAPAPASAPVGQTNAPDSQAPLSVGEWRADTPDGEMKVGGYWAVMDAGDLVTSDDERYDQRIQPRNRDAMASALQVLGIAKRLNPARLFDSATTDGGSPIVMPNGMVVTGNGRVMALRKAMEIGTFPGYAQAVREQAAALGIEIDPRIKNPVLVRAVTTQMDDATLQDFARRSNKPGVLSMNPAENAEADAKAMLDSKIIDLLDTDEEGNLRVASNRSFMEAFITLTGDQGLRRSDGSISPEAYSRARRAILAAILVEAPNARDLITEIVEADPADGIGFAGAVDGVTRAGAALVKLIASNPEYSISLDLAQALGDFVSFNRRKRAGVVKDIDSFLRELDAFWPRSGIAESLIREFATRPNPSAKSIADMLLHYARNAALQDNSSPTLFAMEVLSREDILDNAISATLDPEEAAKRPKTKHGIVNAVVIPAKSSATPTAAPAKTPAKPVRPDSDPLPRPSADYLDEIDRLRLRAEAMLEGRHRGYRMSQAEIEADPVYAAIKHRIERTMVDGVSRELGRKPADVKKWFFDRIPRFQGSKREMAPFVASAILRMNRAQREAYLKAIGWFSGTGTYEMAMAVLKLGNGEYMLPNVKEIELHEYDPGRVEQTRFFWEHGNEIEDYIDSTKVAEIWAAAVDQEMARIVEARKGWLLWSPESEERLTFAKVAAVFAQWDAKTPAEKALKSQVLERAMADRQNNGPAQKKAPATPGAAAPAVEADADADAEFDHDEDDSDEVAVREGKPLMLNDERVVWFKNRFLTSYTDAIVENAHATFRVYDEFTRVKGGKVSIVEGDSYQAEISRGDDVLSFVDPPYVDTLGYSSWQRVDEDGKVSYVLAKPSLNGVDLYEQTAGILERLSNAGHGLVYTDESFSFAKVNKNGTMKRPDVLAGALPVYMRLEKNFDEIGSVQKLIGAGRKETIGIRGGGYDNANERQVESKKLVEEGRRGDGVSGTAAAAGSPGGERDQPGNVAGNEAGASPGAGVVRDGLSDAVVVGDSEGVPGAGREAGRGEAAAGEDAGRGLAGQFQDLGLFAEFGAGSGGQALGQGADGRGGGGDSDVGASRAAPGGVASESDAAQRRYSIVADRLFDGVTGDLQAQIDAAQGRDAKQSLVDAWKAENPERYAELEKMREAALKAAGYTTLAFKGMLSKDWRTGKTINTIKSVNGDWAGFFSSDKAVADKFRAAFATMGEAKTVSVYLDMAGADVVDAKGGKARDVQFDNVSPANRRNDMLDRINRSDRGVIVENTEDEKTVYIPKRPAQIKSADPLALDDSGRLIPPSQWADESKPDIRYSIISDAPIYVTPEQDAAYLAAVKAGDMATAQRMVDEAAERSGLPILDDSASQSYQLRRKAPPKKTIKAYVLRRARAGKLYPLFVSATEPLPTGVWLDATAGKEAKLSKTGRRRVKSRLGDLSYRPAWHAGEIPLATHIGVKDSAGNVYARRSDEVWVEVELSADKNYQQEAGPNGMDRVPEDGFYRFKTNQAMTGEWILAGSMKITRVLSQDEADAIVRRSGFDPMPWEKGRLSLEEYGLTAGETRNSGKLLDPVTYDDAGRVIPLSERFNPKKEDIRYSIVGDRGDDYRGVHRAPTGEFGEGSLDAMDRTYPDDVYGPNGARYYGDGVDARMDAKAIAMMRRVRGKPEALVKVYRAVPKGATTTINAGDWVTPIRDYAEMHGARWDDGADIIERTVKAGELFTEGNSLFEFGWNPKDDVRHSIYSPYQSGRFGAGTILSAIIATDKVKGIKRTDEAYQQLATALRTKTDVAKAKAEADAFLRRETRAASMDVSDIAQSMTQEKFPELVEKLFAKGSGYGVEVGTRAQQGMMRAEKNAIADARGATLHDMVADTGVDVARILLSVYPEAFDPSLEERREKAKEKEKEKGEGGAVRGEFVGPPTEEQVAERTRLDAERKRKAAILVAKLQAWRLQVAEAKAREERDAAFRAEEEARNAEAAGEKSDEDIEAEDEAEMEALIVPPEIIADSGVDLNDALEFAHFLRLWVESWLAGPGVDPGSTLGDRINVAKFRKTMIAQLGDIAHKWLDPNDARTAVNIERQISSIPDSANPDTIEKRTASIIASIQRAAIRQNRDRLVKETRASIQKLALAGKRIDKMEKDVKRKIKGDHEATARYVSEILSWGPQRIEKEMGRLDDIVHDREAAYAAARSEHGKDVKMSSDVQVHRALEKRAALERWGGLKHKLPADILRGKQEIEAWLKTERLAHEAKWEGQKARWDRLADAVQKAATRDSNRAKPGRLGIFGRFADETQATIRQKLETIMQGGGAEAEAAIAEIEDMFNEGSERLGIYRAKYRLQIEDAFEFAVQGQDMTVRQLQALLDEQIPTELNARLSSGEQGALDMNWKQAAQLYAYLLQTATYGDNIAKWGRDGQRELLREALPVPVVRLVAKLQDIYQQRREELSELVEDVTGFPVLNPDPLYMPVKMFLGAREGLDTQVRGWSPLAKSLTPRKVHGRDCDEHADIITMYNESTEAAVRALAFGSTGIGIRSILARQATADAIARHHGDEALRALRAQITDTLNDGWRESGGGLMLGLVRKASNFTTYSSLSFNFQSGLVQMAAAPAWMEVLEGGIGEMLKHIANFDMDSARELVAAPGFISRYGHESFWKMVRDAFGDKRVHPILRLYRSGMTVVQFSDFVASILVGTGVYKTQRAANIKRGVDPQQASEMAARTAWGLIEYAQQSSRVMNTPEFMRRHGLIARQLYKFQSGPLLQLSHETHAFRLLNRAAKGEERSNAAKHLLNVFVANHVMIPLTMTAVQTAFGALLGDEPDKDEILGTLLVEMILGPLASVIFVGAVLSRVTGGVVKATTGLKPWAFPGDGGMPAAQQMERLAKTAALLPSDVANLDWEGFRDDMITMLGQVFAPARYAKKAVYNATDYDPAAERRKRQRQRRR